MARPDLQAFQIYYDDASKAALAPGFIPLDNTSNLRPDWFEFWVMLNYLREHELEEGVWYGFFSPKFSLKSGFDHDFIVATVDRYGSAADVALFSPGWDQMAYFLNPWEQGEVWHPGLMELSQRLLHEMGIEIDLRGLICDASSTVFSNYVLAKRDYWFAWRQLAEKLFACLEYPAAEYGGAGDSSRIHRDDLRADTTYGKRLRDTPMKTFIQERLANVLICSGRFQVVSPDQSATAAILARMFPGGPEVRYLLQTCDLMKRKYRSTGDPQYLRQYWAARKNIRMIPPPRAD